MPGLALAEGGVRPAGDRPAELNTMYERGDVILAAWSTSTSIVRSSSGGTSQDFQ